MSWSSPPSFLPGAPEALQSTSSILFLVPMTGPTVFFWYWGLWHGYFCLGSRISVGPISSKRVLALALNMQCLEKAPWKNKGGL